MVSYCVLEPGTPVMECSYWLISGEAITSTLINVNQLLKSAKIWRPFTIRIQNNNRAMLVRLERQVVLAILPTGFFESLANQSFTVEKIVIDDETVNIIHKFQIFIRVPKYPTVVVIF